MDPNDKKEGHILLINKPYDWTSFDVVRKLRKHWKVKMGHAGTLDPLASGLLILCTGSMTKKIDEFMGMEKEYTGKMILGQTTVTHDLESPVSEAQDITRIKESDLHAIAQQFTGTMHQLPPIHSAIKVKGKKAYEFARKGKEVELKAREVIISKFEITNIHFPEVEFKVVCSKGTYIRSLVRDVGMALGTGAYLSALCRTRIGDFRLEDALDMEKAITIDDLSAL